MTASPTEKRRTAGALAGAAHERAQLQLSALVGSRHEMIL